MDLEDVFGPNPIVVDLFAATQWEAINELIDHLAMKQKIAFEHRDAIVASVRKRESAMSTGIGFRFALPHASTDLVSEVITIVGRSRKGIQFDAVDGKPVNLVFLFLVPTGHFQRHLETLTQLAKLLHRPDFRDGFGDRFQ